jgi:hypothetical protein
VLSEHPSQGRTKRPHCNLQKKKGKPKQTSSAHACTAHNHQQAAAENTIIPGHHICLAGWLAGWLAGCSSEPHNLQDSSWLLPALPMRTCAIHTLPFCML